MTREVAHSDGAWFIVLRRYLVTIALTSLAWEFAHVPLFTLWETGSRGEIIFAAVHCTGGDILIALTALTLALLLFGNAAWPREEYVQVAAVAVAIGVGYTVFSEWLNVEVRKTWMYRDIMPVIPMIGTGLSPFSQWIVLPILGFCWARRGIQ
jgi:hypothetical protein